MRIELSFADQDTESDVEQKFVYPLFTDPHYFALPAHAIKTKKYLAPSDIDKGSGLRRGYFPDYTVWLETFPVAIAEVKSPRESLASGLREARLYAAEFNKLYPPNVNPVKWLIATNGLQIAFSSNDSEDIITFDIPNLGIGTADWQNLRNFFTTELIADHIDRLRTALTVRTFQRPATFLGGGAILKTALGQNSFAAPLAPLLEKYFGVNTPESLHEIVDRAYVPTSDTSSYDATLEYFLRERLRSYRHSDLTELTTTSSSESGLAANISNFDRTNRVGGRLQLVVGHVGSGKTTFIHRFYHRLVPDEVRNRSYWSFIDFNSAPDDLADLEDWMCAEFIESFCELNPSFDPYSQTNLQRIFAPDINRRERGAYKALKEYNSDEYQARIADDLTRWIDDSQHFATQLCRHIGGDRKEILIVVFDNVDRRSRDQQLRIFQAGQWFKERTRSFCILTLRDVTYESYKNEPPLNALVASAHFYIIPPRFTQIVKRRLDVILEDLIKQAPHHADYTLSKGIRIRYPRTELGTFLLGLYLCLFHRRTQIAGAVEALSGRNVRKALGMFADIITSKHLSEEAITRAYRGGSDFNISEANVIRILMRTRYLYAAEQNGYTLNLLNVCDECVVPSNFHRVEILFWLFKRRKQSGDIRAEGYFSIDSIAYALDKLGFRYDDVVRECLFLAERGLVSSERQDTLATSPNDCIKIQASGYIHLRFLLRRTEYLVGFLPETPIFDELFAREIANKWKINEGFTDIRGPFKRQLVKELFRYLWIEFERRERRHGFFGSHAYGSRYLLKAVEEAKRFNEQDPQPKRSASLI